MQAIPQRNAARSYTPKRIDVWVSDAQQRRKRTLQSGTSYLLHIRAVDEPSQRAAPDIPAAGLDARCTLIARGITFEAAAGGAVTVEPTMGDSAVASFALHIPHAGESVTRTVSIKPLSDGTATIDVLLHTRGTLYRQLHFEIIVQDTPPVLGSPVPESAVALVAESAPVRGDQTTLHHPHEWQDVPGVLSITVLAPVAALGGSVRRVGEASRTTPPSMAQWGVDSGAVSGLIDNLRVAMDRLREQHTPYLNAIAPADLETRLASPPPQYSWSHLTTAVDTDHQAAWEQVRISAELRDLARAGHQLYNRIFPRRDGLRELIDRLEPGHRIEINWWSTGAAPVPVVPWAMLYREDPDAGGAVDPLNFLGLRYRFKYTPYAMREAVDHYLGRPDATSRGYLLYHHTSTTDSAAVEAERQRSLWSGPPSPIFAPELAGNDPPKEQLRRLLIGDGSRRMPVLYLFCHCVQSQGANRPELVFGKGADSSLAFVELPTGELPDRPLIFANACQTAAGSINVANELPRLFFDRGASAYLGTEALVPIELASRFAQIFFHFFDRRADRDGLPITAGEALAQARLFLWTQYANIGGLFYTYLNDPDLYMADEPEVTRLPQIPVG